MALTGSERVRKTKDRKEASGLYEIKIWVAYQLNDANSDADKVRAYAAKLPLTAQCIKEFKELK